MQKNCLYCGNPFSFQRNTRKYCSDNCKQMAYFSRNGFTPAHGSSHKCDNLDYAIVKDVKYAGANSLEDDKNDDDTALSTHDIETIAVNAKCLIRNLLRLSRHQYVKRNSFLEFAATWSQLVRWRSFKKAESRLPHHALVLELEGKLTALAKAHKENDLIELTLSQELNDQLEDALDELKGIRKIKFSEIRF